MTSVTGAVSLGAAGPQGGDAQPGLLERIAEEPALAQLVVVLALGALGLMLFVRAVRRVREARELEAVRDYVLGVEQALCGDAAGAARRLGRVVLDDPSNTSARLLHAEVLTALGRPAEAHREHLALRHAFGSRATRNDLGLARALSAAGRPAEAADLLERSFGPAPTRVDALRAAFDCACDSERNAAAVELGASLAARLPAGEERDRIRARVVGCAERAVRSALQHGELDLASRVLGSARRAAGDRDPTVQRVAGRVERATARSATDRGRASTAGPEAVVPFSEGWIDGPLVLARLESPGRVLDAIEGNRQHVARLCDACAEGDTDATEELCQLGGEAVAELLEQALARGPDDAAFSSVFARIGVDAITPLVEAWTARRGRGFGHGRPVEVLSRILIALGPGVQPTLEPLLASDDRELRKALVDYHLALADVSAFECVIDALPLVEVVQRLNDVSEELLIPFLRALPGGHFVLEVLLPDGGFVRDVTVLDAIPGAAAPAALERLLASRGFSRSLVDALIDHLADPRLAAVAGRLLDSFGAQAVPSLVMAFADADRSRALRDAVRTRLVARGPAAVQPLCRCFGATSTPLDAEVVAALVAIGDVAIADLREAYRQGGLLERIAGPFARRRTHRREMLVRTLGALGSLAARTALVGMREREPDPDLVLRLAQAIHRIDDAGPKPGDAGTAGSARHGG